MKDRTNNHRDSNVITMSEFTASQRNAEAITTPAGEAFLARGGNSHMDLNEQQAKLAADRMSPEEVHSFFSREVENSKTLLTEDRKDYEPTMNQAYFIVDAMGGKTSSLQALWEPHPYDPQRQIMARLCHALTRDSGHHQIA